MENIWSEVKRGECRNPGLSSLRNSDELWTLVSDVWNEIASSQLYIQLLIESCGQNSRVLNFLLKSPVSDNSPFKNQSINSYFVYVSEVLRDTNVSAVHILHIICLQQACQNGVKWATWGPFQFFW
jgi:hypothetical protein